MRSQFEVVQGLPYPLGVTRDSTGINIALNMNGKSFGIVLFDSHKNKIGSIELSNKASLGDIKAARILWNGNEDLYYQLYCDEHIIFDEHIRQFCGHEKFGNEITAQNIYGKLSFSDFDWEEDSNPLITYDDSFIYCMHVRGFTAHASSKVEGRGHFLGIQEKIPYLQKLGVTSIELLPVYEVIENLSGSLNYWGFQKGFYYAVRNAYSSGDGSVEFKNLIKTLHNHNMEVILQFYFTDDVPHYEILSILRYWKLEYHVDGFHLKGGNIPLLLIGQDPLFADTKLFYYDFPLEQLYKYNDIVSYRRFASYKDEYMYIMRRFLKGDEDMLKSVLKCMRKQPKYEGQINYFTNYYGFTMNDMVSYERKHNELNGENNNDGNDYNHTWNCGVEGKTRRKAILSLRNQQIRNALCLLFFSQGTPLIYMGDEFGNSKNGNNNSYGLDNITTWLNWNLIEKNRELFCYIKKLVAIRKNHPILHNADEFRLIDYKSCGYPDLSYHSSKAWQPDLNNCSRNVGIMYCGKYVIQNGHEDCFFYMAVNMHWESHEFALPLLPKSMEWALLLDTREWAIYDENPVALEEQQMVDVPARSIQIYISIKEGY